MASDRRIPPGPGRPTPPTTTTGAKAPATVAEAISQVARDNSLSRDEWVDILKPLLEKTPKTASAEARQVLRLWARAEIAPDVQPELDAYLRSRGYLTPLDR